MCILDYGRCLNTKHMYSKMMIFFFGFLDFMVVFTVRFYNNPGRGSIALDKKKN